MANGPLGGFMPTPAAPAQPPSVKLDTTASSRGTFNNFLKSMNGATSLNPPSMAPMVGANPMMAPAANIDIFNQPVQNFQFGGFADDTVGDTSGTFSVDDQGNVSDDFSIGGGGFGGTGGDEQSFVDALTDPASTNFDSPATDVFADDPSSATPMGLTMPSGQNLSTQATAGTNLNFDQNTLNEIKAQINNRNEVALTEEDNFFNKDGSLKPSGIAELNKRNAEDLQQVIAGNVPASTYISADTASDILGDADILDLGKKTDQIDPFAIQPTFQNFGLPGVSGLPNVGSTRSTVAQDQARAIANLVGDRAPTIEEQLQQNVLADRGRALGPTTFSDDLANFQERVTLSPPPEGFEEQVGTMGARIGGGMFPKMYAPGQSEIRYTTKGTTPKEQRELRELRDIDEAIEVAERGPLTFQTQTQKSTAPEDFEENVGLPFSDSRMRDIERLLNVPEGQRRTGEGDDPNVLSGIPSALNIFERIPREQMAIDVALGRPRSFTEMIRGVTAPNLQTETMKQFTDRLQRNIADESGETRDFTSKTIPESQLIRNNRGRITAITDASGRTITGVNPDEQIGGDDNNQLPIIRRPIVPTAKDDDDMIKKPPNIIGGIDPIVGTPVVTTPTVVASPFAPSSANISPVTFDTGELNKLIELLTGVSAKPVVSKQEGGLVSAVDEFLASGS